MISLNEIRRRAIEFSKEWELEENEDAEAKSFLDAFFNVFGVSRRRIASFEQRVKKIDGRDGYIDLLWKGVLLVEQKSRGKDLDRAHEQAIGYFPGLKEEELPRYILVSDFERFRLYDLDKGTEKEFALKELHNKIHLFDFITGYEKREYKEEDPVNIKAAEMMGRLHDRLEIVGYTGHALEVYLVRLLFCLFADDTGIFEKGVFQDYIRLKTNEDGSDLAHHLSTLFHILNTPEDSRLENLDESLKAFPYVNGKLFAEMLPPASFDAPMRRALLDCAGLDWGKISPAVFGSLFQSVMDKDERRQLGAHYTSEKNILKVIKPLFLDELWAEYEKVKSSRQKLLQFHEKLAKLRFLDPACGCGNFLLLAYRELRLLEIEVLKNFIKQDSVASFNIETLMKVNVDQFYGIEIDEFASQIARVAMWLMDHQMNVSASTEFGHYFRRLPLTSSATIINENALRVNWEDIIEPSKLSFIFGNPPFVGKQYQKQGQKEDMAQIFDGVKGYGVLDYVSAWYVKAAQYIQGTQVKVSFVSTNSIAQGEQVGVLWKELLTKYKVKINFAHRTFRWGNDARGRAAVHCVIVGFANYDAGKKFIYEYGDINEDPHEVNVKNINPYLVDAPDVVLESRRKPICPVPPIIFGSMPNDGGNLLLSDDEKSSFLNLMEAPEAEGFIRQFVGADEFINNIPRWCLWLKDASPEVLRKLPKVLERVEKVRLHRDASNRLSTRLLAETPTLFGENRQPDTQYLLLPGVSSENRQYIPIGFIDPKVIASNATLVIPDATLYHFGVLTSLMHMTWVRHVCGRLESRYRYSAALVYNNFPWPEVFSEEKRAKVEVCARAVLDAREKYPAASLADLYDPRTMPVDLTRAHQALDKAVDLCYRAQPFSSETKRMEFLFELYESYLNLGHGNSKDSK